MGVPALGPCSSSEAEARLQTRHLSASPEFRSPWWGSGWSHPGLTRYRAAGLAAPAALGLVPLSPDGGRKGVVSGPGW